MSGKNHVVVYFLIITLCIIIYFKCLFYGITNSDDEVLIAGNLSFLNDFSNIFKVFTTDAFYQIKSIDLYRPLQSASYIIDAQWGTNPVFIAHLTNLILHILNCLIVFNLLKMLEFRERIAFLGALVYSVHYLFMTAVAWLPARGDLLLAFFVFLSLSSFIRIFSAGGWKSYFLHGIFFTLAMFSKESAVVLPVLFVLYLWAYGKTALLTRTHLVLPLLYLVVQLVYFRLKSFSVILYKGDTGFIPLMKNIRTLPETLAKFYLPLNISTLPAYKLSATGAGIVVIALLIGMHVIYKKKCDRRVLFYAGWTLIFIIPAMLYFPEFYNFAYEHVDHRGYIICFGVLMITLNAVQVFNLDRKRYFNVVCALLLIYLALFNLHYSRNYSNPSAFAMRAISTNPKSALAFSIYGNELYLQGRDDEALENLSKSISIYGKFTPPLHTRATIYRKRGQNREALADLDALLTRDPKYDSAEYVLRAQIKIDLQDFEGAVRDCGLAIRLSPDNADASKMLQELNRTVRDNRLLPNVSMAYQLNRQGVAVGERQDYKRAAALFRKALELDPGFYGVNLNLGNALFKQGRIAEACDSWRVAKDHGSTSADEQLQGFCSK